VYENLEALHHIPIVYVVSAQYRKVRPSNLGENLTLKLSS